MNYPSITLIFFLNQYTITSKDICELNQTDNAFFFFFITLALHYY